MDSGIAALIGSAIGSMTGVLTTILNDHLRRKRRDKLAKIRKETLFKLLSNPKFKWRKLESLCDSVGSDEDTTIPLLLEIGARKSRSAGSTSWGLVSRNPWPDEEPSN
jgi:hypothetical protein